MNYLAQLADDVRAVIGLAWPEVKPDGVYHAHEFLRNSFNQKVADSELPLAVMDFNLLPEASGRFGVTNYTETGTVAIYYVTKDTSDFDGLIAKAEALRDNLTGHVGGGGQVFGYPAIGWGMGLPLNAYFLNNQRPYWGIAVTATVVIGRTSG